MNKKGTYRKEIELYHDEIPARLNVDTGELITLKPRKNNIPENSEVFEPNSFFKKTYPNGWAFLRKYLTAEESNVASILAAKAFSNTNSLNPLNDDTAISELSEIFGISRNIVKDMLKKLFELGVYGKFEVADINVPYTKYWIFNPYLSFSGSIIKSDIASLFKNTHCGKAFYNPNYELTEKEIKDLIIRVSTIKRRKIKK